MSSKRSTTIARWGRYLMAGALLAVLVASAISAQLFATSDTPHGYSLEDAHPTLYVHGDRLRPLVEETDGAQTLNIYGPGGRIIAQAARDDQGSQEVRYPLADHLGSTRAILDADDNAVAHFEYAPHGETATSGAAAAEARYRYTGHPYDESQGLYQTPARGYDPATGRFLSVDPQRQDASPYVYAGNNPVGFIDPTGGVKVPFFMRSGFWSERENFASAGLTKWQVRSSHDSLRDISTKLGKHGEQRIHDATRVFGSHPDKLPQSVSEASRFLGGRNSDRAFGFNNQLYWFIGDDKGVELPAHFPEAVLSIRDVSRGDLASSNYASPDFAENIVLVDFTQPGSDAVDKVERYLNDRGFKPSRLDASDLLLAQSEERARSRSPINTPENTTVSQPTRIGLQGSDRLGGAGPGPPAATGQSTTQLSDNPPMPGYSQPQEMQGILGQPFPEQQASTTNTENWQELIPEGQPGLLKTLTTFGEPRVSD